MRRIGTLPDESLARRFCDYLLTLSIEATADSVSSEPETAWSVWVRDEKDVENAKEELVGFERSPEATRYQVAQEAGRIRDQRISDHQERVKLRHESARATAAKSGGGLAPGTAARQLHFPITIAIVVLSVLASFGSDFGKRTVGNIANASFQEQVHDKLSFVAVLDFVQSDEDAFASIRKGEAWRLVTPMFLHGDRFHLLFNMLWIFILGSALERLHGSGLFLLLVLGTAMTGLLLNVSLTAEFLPDALRGSPFTIGASGAVYGLFGFLWVRPSRDPGYPLRMDPMNVVLMLGWLVACMTPLVANVANGAHLGGLLAGILAALVWRRAR